MPNIIKVTKDGPYIVPDGVSIIEEKSVIGEEGVPEKWQKGKKIPCERGCHLCRCGESKDKPFCDGTHSEIGFDGTETADEKKFETTIFEGKKLILKDKVDLCSIARFCDRAGQIWNIIDQKDKKSTEIAIEEACNCPSGRLVLVEKGSGKEIEPDFDQAISVTTDDQAGVGGPLWVKGRVEIESADGKKYEIRNRITLCRCGHSNNKPFCDGTHLEIGFDKK